MTKRRRGNGQGSLFKRSKGGPFIASWYDHNGERRERSTRTTDKKAALQILNKKVTDTALRREGVIDARKDRYASENRKPLSEQVPDYITHCRHVGHAPRHVDQKESHLQRLIDATGAARLSDLTADTLEQYIRGLVDRGRSARTANFVRQIAVAFASWCVKTRRLESNPLLVVPKLNEENDRRRVRRPLPDDELARLLAVAEEHGRKPWYLTAALGGLRKGDLQRLKWSDIDLEQGTITIRGGKSKRVDVIPLHPQLADEFKRLRDESRATPQAKVFPETVTDSTRLKDFLRAGLAHEVVVTDDVGQPVLIGKNKRPKTKIVAEDEEGRVIDLHALRTTLGTNLARAGVAPQLAQRILRHADYRTTQKHYTVLGLTDTARAIEQLPPISSCESPRAVATGTDGKVHENDPPLKSPQQGHESARVSANRRNESHRDGGDGETHKHLRNAKKCESARRNATQRDKAGEGTRTLNIQLGRLTLYQLSYARRGVAYCSIT